MMGVLLERQREREREESRMIHRTVYCFSLLDHTHSRDECHGRRRHLGYPQPDDDSY